MPWMGQYRAIAILLFALCLLASFFYLRVWSSIDSDREKSATVPLTAHRKQEGEVLFRHHHHHEQKQAKHRVEDKQPLQEQNHNAEPFPGPAADQRKTTSKLSSTLPQPRLSSSSSLFTSSSSSPLTPAPSLSVQHKLSENPQQKQRERQRKNELKKLKKLEKAERARKKEEKRLKQAARVQKLQQLELEPFPALISTNNARVAGLNQRAFVEFCHAGDGKNKGGKRNPSGSPGLDLDIIAPDRLPVTGGTAQAGAGAGAVSESSLRNRQRNALVVDKDFSTYAEWIEYIHNKNSGQEQEIHEDQQASHPSIASQGSHKPKPRALFWERPLRGWIVNRSAIMEPCNRQEHTSAHCLAYLSQDHLYLIPSQEARAFPNRVHVVATSPDGVRLPQDIELDTSYTEVDPTEVLAPALVPDGSTPTTQPRPSTQSKRTCDAATMHFHIFWRGIISDKLSLAAHAFLFTQPLDRARLHLWIDSTDLTDGKPEDYEQNPFAKDLVSRPLNRFVKLHAWNQEVQEKFAYPAPPSPTQGTETVQQQHEEERKPGRVSEQGQSNTTFIEGKLPAVALSDEARFLILHRYGGMYLDADVLLLRDMSPLYDSGNEFAYEWSSTQMYNTAVLRLNRGSGVARRVLDGAKAKEKEIQAKQLEKQVEDKIKNGNLPALSKEDAKEDKGEGLELELKRIQEANRAKKRTRGNPKHGQPAAQSSASTGIQSTSGTTSPSPPALLLAVPFPPTAIVAETEEDAEEMLGQNDAESLFAPSANGLVKRGEMRPNEIYHPARLRGYLNTQGKETDGLENNGLIMLPTAIFDPLWLRIDGAESPIGLDQDEEWMMEDVRTFPDVFSNLDSVCPAQQKGGASWKNAVGGREGEGGAWAEGKGGFAAGPEVFFTGAYAYHWHNNWETPIQSQSWMGLMRRAYAEFLAGERPNLYGEWFREDSDILLKR